MKKKYLITNLLGKYYISKTYINGLTSIYKGKLLVKDKYDFGVWINPNCGIYITLFAKEIQKKKDYNNIYEFTNNFNTFFSKSYVNKFNIPKEIFISISNPNLYNLNKTLGQINSNNNLIFLNKYHLNNIDLSKTNIITGMYNKYSNQHNIEIILNNINITKYNYNENLIVDMVQTSDSKFNINSMNGELRKKFLLLNYAPNVLKFNYLDIDYPNLDNTSGLFFNRYYNFILDKQNSKINFNQIDQDIFDFSNRLKKIYSPTELYQYGHWYHKKYTFGKLSSVEYKQVEKKISEYINNPNINFKIYFEYELE